MVLTTRVGKKRPFWRGFLLSVLTFGLYHYYWLFKTHHEVFRQYELDREGRDDGLVWLVLGIVIPVLILVYYWKFVDNVKYVRERMRLPRGVSPGAFLGAHVAGSVVVFLGLIAFAFAPVFYSSGGSMDSALGFGFLAFFGSWLVSFVIIAFAYFRLQRDINETWDWYDSHMGITVGGPQSPPTPLPYASPPPPPTIPPAPPEQPAAPPEPWPPQDPFP